MRVRWAILRGKELASVDRSFGYRGPLFGKCREIAHPNWRQLPVGGQTPGGHSTSGINCPAHNHSGRFIAFCEEGIAHAAVQLFNERGFRHEKFPS